MDKDDLEHFKQLGAPLRQGKDLSRQQDVENLALARDPEYVLQKATMLMASYRKDEAADPEVYVSAIAAVLSRYPISVVNYVTDPRSGIQSELKFLPSIAEVRQACEREFNQIAQDAERARRVRKQLAEREADQKQGKENRRLTYDELKEKYGNGKGGWLSEGSHRRTYTEAEKAAFMESARQAGKEISGIKISNELRHVLDYQAKVGQDD